MDIGTLKNYSDLAHDLNQIKKNALEKLKSRQIIAYNGRLFRADADTINVVQTFKAHSKEFYMLDTNDNPCHIIDPDEFLRILIERNQETLNSYHQLHEDLKFLKMMLTDQQLDKYLIQQFFFRVQRLHLSVQKL